MSNLGIAGFEEFKNRNQTRKDLESYFEEIFYHKPTEEQLKMFHNVLIGKEQDAQKMIDFCVAKQDESECEKQSF